jgi:hypothetical protein
VPVVPILGILCCLLLMFSLPADNWLRLAVWLLIGLVIYYFYGRHHSVMATTTMAEIGKHGASPTATLPRHGTNKPPKGPGPRR